MPRSFSSGALSIWSYAKNVASFFSDSTFVIAAVSVVFPWSTCPIVPMLMCGFVRSNFAFAMLVPPNPQNKKSRCSAREGMACAALRKRGRALDRDRTGDLFLTKEVLCQLSYKGVSSRRIPHHRGHDLYERETRSE